MPKIIGKLINQIYKKDEKMNRKFSDLACEPQVEDKNIRRKIEERVLKNAIISMVKYKWKNKGKLKIIYWEKDLKKSKS
jgi:hypothetical protein